LEHVFDYVVTPSLPPSIVATVAGWFQHTHPNPPFLLFLVLQTALPLGEMHDALCTTQKWLHL
jgi:hypothetical protein